MGDHLLGVRTDTYDLDTRLQAALADHLYGGPLAYNNYSIRLSDPAADGVEPLKRLYVGADLYLSSRSGARIVDALLAHLAGWVLQGRPDLVALRSVAAVGRGIAVLLPGQSAGHMPLRERRLVRAGLSLVDAPLAYLDADTGELVVPDLPLEVDTAPLADLQDLGTRRSAEGPPVAPGRYPVACWAFEEGDAEQSADALDQARAAVVASPDPDQAERVLRTTLASAAVVRVPSAPAEAAAHVARAVARPSGQRVYRPVAGPDR